ncbi:pyridoxamine 5'-phosphate oxidase family protein [Flavimaricola marinus]|uniref:Pyridoxamine 5'-phosphate oxidase n=1 Tax=Flavimaricola marinus TaxID=1819565 RepID=A0A238LB24_9RHOB|nr:pyridoxamine 5'-phosphate oxidase family protein [Flavimaricola marinus]SMY06801.1 Pyridoxamine 5'-phosphate oxidase [Flavimaricola marinus]
METITDIAALEALYGTPSEPAMIKVARKLTPLYRDWITASRFVVLTTVGPEGTDGSPRGDDGPVVTVEDPQTLLMPDWRGNNRMDSLRNIVRDGRVSLMFMVPGSTTVVRVNGTAELTADPALCARFDRAGTQPRTVIVIRISEVYTQCARAILRAGLWTSGDESAGLPSPGAILAEIKAGFDGETYDAEWSGRAKATMW